MTVISERSSPLMKSTHLVDALLGLVEEDLRHALHGDGKGDHRVLLTGLIIHPLRVAQPHTVRAKYHITCLTEQQLLQRRKKGHMYHSLKGCKDNQSD